MNGQSFDGRTPDRVSRTRSKVRTSSKQRGKSAENSRGANYVGYYEKGISPSLLSSYNPTTAASTKMMHSGSGTTGNHRHVMTFGGELASGGSRRIQEESWLETQ